ncbi:MAG: hypothetical protein V9H26_12930 [Verrucomicrobiota bacterium]
MKHRSIFTSSSCFKLIMHRIQLLFSKHQFCKIAFSLALFFVMQCTSSISFAQSIAAGTVHSLFLCSNSAVPLSNGRNVFGQLGDGTTTDKLTPVQVNGLIGITAIAAGSNHSLFLKSDGTVWACGSNSSGQLGDGTNTNRSSPVQVIGLTGITAISGGKGTLFF